MKPIHARMRELQREIDLTIDGMERAARDNNPIMLRLHKKDVEAQLAEQRDLLRAEGQDLRHTARRLLSVGLTLTILAVGLAYVTDGWLRAAAIGLASIASVATTIGVLARIAIRPDGTPHPSILARHRRDGT